MAKNNLDLFDDFQKRVDKTKDRISEDIRNRHYKALSQALAKEPGVKVKKEDKGKTKGIRVTKEVDPQDDRFPTDRPVDLKPYFRRSPNAKKNANGGWSLVVPIRRYSTHSKKASYTQKMSRKLYDDVREKAGGETNRTIVSDYLYDRNQVSPIAELNYTPRSNNLYVQPNPTGRGNIYTAFRVVSDKSPANSWIINRGKAKEENLSTRIRKIIRAVKRGTK